MIGSKQISLCPAFFDKPKESQVVILLHETFHAHTGAIDHGYWNGTEWVDLRNKPIDIGPDKLIHTADAYENFIQCWFAERK
jgi:hypothetical protein